MTTTDTTAGYIRILNAGSIDRRTEQAISAHLQRMQSDLDAANKYDRADIVKDLDRQWSEKYQEMSDRAIAAEKALSDRDKEIEIMERQLEPLLECYYCKHNDEECSRCGPEDFDGWEWEVQQQITVEREGKEASETRAAALEKALQEAIKIIREPYYGRLSPQYTCYEGDFKKRVCKLIDHNWIVCAGKEYCLCCGIAKKAMGV